MLANELSGYTKCMAKIKTSPINGLLNAVDVLVTKMS